MDTGFNTPEWIPESYDKEVTGKVSTGSAEQGPMQKKINKRYNYNIAELFEGILNKNTTILSKAITLIESNSPKHIELSQQLLKNILPYTGQSIRVGITGSPGSGKSTFIESLGNYLIDQGNRVAVLAVDPSSIITGGSILGDKTRMEILSGRQEAYIRPSPSSGTLGGVAKKTRETILLCEAAGYNIILIETVGVGQSEVTVRSLVDIFLLLLIPGSGDELQGIKKGVVELSDLLFVNKCDGELKDKALLTKVSYSSALKLLQSPTENWKPKVLMGSALNNDGIDKVWNQIMKFTEITKGKLTFEKRRQAQSIEWIYTLLQEYINNKYINNRQYISDKKYIENELLNNMITPTEAVDKLITLMKI
ncbi:MAG TPA: methylmalonyl Co-A mutase-associated GTPase MeaB [Candidatus Kapabacteria bacterium]|nr:methylmalonyl Co-A mutase-associated GTPase MeaB [Candidatus Kapabacteria bacterium]